jgi:hypothetical protein
MVPMFSITPAADCRELQCARSKVLLCIFAFVLGGCTTVVSLGPLPKNDDELRQSKDDLVKRYPEIDKYEWHSTGKSTTAANACYGLASCALLLSIPSARYTALKPPEGNRRPRQAEVIQELGEPIKIVGKDYLGRSVVWVALAAGIDFAFANFIIVGDIALRPYHRTYYFQRGRYCISAEFEQGLKTKYRKLMTSWHWEEKKCMDAK